MRPLIVCAAVAFCTAVQAGEYNHQNLLVGTRSAGMAGADVALADSVTGTYYNPAGLVDSPTHLVSVSLSAYRLDMSGFAEVEVRDGRAARATGFKFSSFPLNAGLAARLGDGLGLTRHTLAFNVFAEDYEVGGTRVDVRLPEVVDLYLRVRRQDQRTIRFAPTWAAQKGAFSFGVSPMYLLRLESVLVDTLIDIQNSVTYRLRDTQGVHGALAVQVGALWRVTERLRVGASLTSPSARLHGSAVGTEFLLRNGTEPVLDPASSRPMTHRTPSKLSVGAAWTTEGGTRFGLQLTGHTGVPRYEIIERLVQAELRPIVNGNLGAEWPLGESTLLRLGTFTNFAATPAPPRNPPDELDDPARLPNVDYYGATAGLSLISGESSMDLSVVYQFGTGQVPSETSRGYDTIKGNVVLFMLGGTYAFESGGTP